ncbi:Multiple PDZ domain protein [Eumeta japonica]|uniref:Multiple PDZ domain protein n=1 Tax=Eumeta variegata TaxID=151549 RepID=A0A4C1YNK5_EUMVA|nr:Multiple PDZ domain protein [Eumeta japonica]
MFTYGRIKAMGSKGPSRPTSRNQTPDPVMLKTPGPSRPQTPKPAPSPAKVEPPPDPATAPAQPNKDTVIEINTQNQSLGIILLGGSDTLINGPAAVILEVYPTGAAGKDGRLRAGDQIVECGGVTITKEMSHERVCLTIKQNAHKIKMTVFRPDPIPYEDVEVELPKKPGKGLGLGMMARTPPPGVYISDINRSLVASDPTHVVISLVVVDGDGRAGLDIHTPESKTHLRLF